MFDSSSTKPQIPTPLKALLVLLLLAFLLFCLGQVIVFLWNTILVKVTGVKMINFWEALGLFALARILFGGFRFHSGPPWNKAKRRARWNAKWKSKWMDMSEEERAVFRKKWQERCGKK